MVVRYPKATLFLILLAAVAEAAFVPRSSTVGWQHGTRTISPARPRHMVPADFILGDYYLASSSSVLMDSSWSTATAAAAAAWNNVFWIATIDADISKLSDNEFAPVFMGGLAVMFGGLLSVVFVGFIVDSQDLSARIVADSYIQNSDNNDSDQEFWKGLSEEEKKKTQELLRRMKESKNSSGKQSPPVADTPTIDVAAAATTTTKPQLPTVETSLKKQPVAVAADKPEQKKVGMFDDYGAD